MGIQDRDWYKDVQKERDAKMQKRSRPIADLLPKSAKQPNYWEYAGIAAVWCLIIVALTLALVYARSRGH